MTPGDAVAGIAATTTYAGLKCTAVLDANPYPRGEEIDDQRMRYLEDRVLDRGAVRGEWNYTVRPAPRPAPAPDPGPEPGPGQARRCPQAILNHPALTGMDPGGLQTLAAALDIPSGACREQRNYARRGHRRINAIRNGDGSNGRRRLDLTDHLIAWRLREHLHLPVQAIAVLLGVDASTVSHATATAVRLLAGTGIPPPPAAPPPGTLPRTPAELLDYAAAAGLTLTIPENSQTMPEHFRTRGENLRHARS